ncbi:MAG: hypothetical protein OEW75_00570 [Cyclobacteriaceae bacterium]|nr:hypothetical protein [Cyclobacteriaceae bacterium]
MNRLLLPLLLLTLSEIVSAQSMSPRFRTGYDYSQFEVLDTTGYILIPVEWESNGKVDNIKVYGNNSDINIFFYNPVTEEKRFLFQDSVQIITRKSGYLLQNHYNDTTKRPLNWEYLYFTVKNTDYNRNGELNQDDPSSLYQAKYDGTEVTRITPANYYLKKYEYIKQFNIIIAVLEKDENGDGKFDKNDSEVLYKIDLSNPENSKVVSVLQKKREGK